MNCLKELQKRSGLPDDSQYLRMATINAKQPASQVELKSPAALVFFEPANKLFAMT